MRFLMLLLLLAPQAFADTTITPNIPGLNVRDITSRSVTVTRGVEIYQSIPGMPGVRDYTQQGYYRDGNTISPEAVPGLRGSSDYSEPSFSIDDQP